MADNTDIEWADSTFNPWIGCTKVSPACDNCYAENLMDNRMHVVQWGPGMPRKRTSAKNWKLPLQWNETPFFQCMACGKRGTEAELLKTDESICDCFKHMEPARRRVFCASLADVFDKEVPEQWRYDLWQLIHQTPNLDWLLLTKRIGNAKQPEVYRTLSWPHNVWLGATICNQAEAERDIPKLLAINATVRFLSIEPLLGQIDLRKRGILSSNSFGIDWVIVGGESGANARPMHPKWVRSLRDQCYAAGVHFLFKQWGEWLPISEIYDGTDYLYKPNKKAKAHESQDEIDDIYGKSCIFETGMIQLDGELLSIVQSDSFKIGAMQGFKVGKKAAGRLLDGITHTEFPRGPNA